MRILSFNALSFNALSLRNKIDELRCLTRNEDFDVIAITETFVVSVNNYLISEYTIDEFVLFNKDRVINGRGGGVAIYVRRSLQPVDKTPLDCSGEHLCVRTNTDRFEINIP